MKRTASLHDDRVVEELMAAVELREISDPLAEQHWHEADTHLIYQTERECLLRDRRARDSDILVAGDLSGVCDRGFNTVDEGRSRPPLGGVLGRAMRFARDEAPSASG